MIALLMMMQIMTFDIETNVTDSDTGMTTMMMKMTMTLMMALLMMIQIMPSDTITNVIRSQ